MKIGLQSVLLLALVMIAMPSDAVTVLRLYFDSPAVVDSATYAFGLGDIPGSGTVSIHFNRPLVGSERDYGFTDPAMTIDTGNYPDIVVPPPVGYTRQGGNAFFTCLGTAADPQEHIGWYINSGNNIGIPHTSDFTAEAVFMLARIGTDVGANQVFGSEWSLHQIFGNDMIAGNGPLWDFRVFPNGLIGGTGQLQLHTDFGFGNERNVNGPNMVINRWYHAACVYTYSTNRLEFFVDGVSQGFINPVWGGATQPQRHWWIGAWPSNGANRGLAGWIDAVSLNTTALTPANFVLPIPTNIENWTEY